MLDVLALGVALSMDVTAVAAARGLAGPSTREIVTLSVVFAAAHAAMLAIGWGAGAAAADVVAEWDHWLAFGVLTALGVRAIHGARGAGDAEPTVPRADWRTIALLALVTSIDAVAAGLTLPLLSATPVVSIGVIAAVVAVLTITGALLGRALSGRLGVRLQIVGGLALIAIGCKILIEHLA